MVDVFISYSREDLAAVTRIAEAVEAEGYDVWWDADLPPHLSYGDVITAKIGAAKAAIVVWSKASVQSEWVRAEADVARNQKKLIQTALDNVMPPLPFNQIQYAEIGDWQGDPDHPGWRKVKVSLAELCGRPQLTRPMSAGAEHRPAWPAAAPAPAATPAPTSSRGPLYAVLAAVGGVAVLGAGVMLGRGTADSGSAEEPAPGETVPAALLSPVASPSPAQSSAAPTVAPAADTLNRHVIVANISSQTLRELYASPVTSDTWEEDLLAEGVLPAGERIDANIHNGTDECNYDLKAVMADGSEHIRRGINVCSISQWTIGDSGDSTD